MQARFWDIISANFAAQVTTYNTGVSFEEKPVVHSDVTAALVCTDEDAHRDFLFVTKKESESHINLLNGGMCSLMWGSTNPQIHHFFKQLNAKCWTSVVTGRGEEIPAEEGSALLFAKHFQENPFLIGALQEASPTQQRTNFKVLKNQLKDEDEEDDSSAVRPEEFSLWRLKQENGFLGRPDSGLDKMSVLTIPELDPLGSVAQRWVSRINFRRDILTEGVRTAYSIPVINPFAFHIDKKGIYIMGQQLEDPTWQEFFLEWGPSMEFTEPRQVTTWWEEFVQQANVSYDNVQVSKPDGSR